MLVFKEVCLTCLVVFLNKQQHNKAANQEQHLFFVYILRSMKTVPKMTFSGLWVRTFIMYL